MSVGRSFHRALDRLVAAGAQRPIALAACHIGGPPVCAESHGEQQCRCHLLFPQPARGRGRLVSIELLVQALLNGFGLAMVYVLVALGLTLIFSILEIINFAHGEFYMLGGYVTYYAYAVFGLNYFATLVLAILSVGIAGVVAERLIFHDLRGRALNAFIVSLGLLGVMQAGAQLAFGVLDKPVPSAFSGVVRLSGLVMSVERFVVTLSAIVLIVGLYLFLRLSRPGRAMRAVAQDPDAAALQGVNIDM